jgi:hypothetical protein
VLLLILLAAGVFAVLCGVGWAIGLPRKLHEHFPDDPPVARVLRAGDTALGFIEQVVLVGLVAFLVFVTVIWFAGDHPLPSQILFGLITAGAIIGLAMPKVRAKSQWELVTVLVVGFVFLVGAIWIASTGKPLEGGGYDVRYACFLLAFLGGAFAAHHRRLLSMDFVSHFLPHRVKPWTRVLNTAFGAFIAGVFVKYAHKIYEAQAAERHTRGAHEHWMPEWTANAAMLIGATLLLLHLVVQILIDLDYLVRGKIPPEPAMGAA